MAGKNSGCSKQEPTTMVRSQGGDSRRVVTPLSIFVSPRIGSHKAGLCLPLWQSVATSEVTRKPVAGHRTAYRHKTLE